MAKRHKSQAKTLTHGESKRLLKKRSEAAKKGWATRRRKKLEALGIQRIPAFAIGQGIDVPESKRKVASEHLIQLRGQIIISRLVKRLEKNYKRTTHAADKAILSKSERWQKYWANEYETAKREQTNIAQRIERTVKRYTVRTQHQLAPFIDIDSVREGIARRLTAVKEKRPKAIPAEVDDIWFEMTDWGFDEQIDETDIWDIYKEI